MIPGTKVLDNSGIQKIDRASRELLSGIGIKVAHEEALDIFNGAGANVDLKSQIVKIPDNLIEETIRKCQPTVRIYGREGVEGVVLGSPTTYFSTGGFPNFILDMETGKFREVSNQDIIDWFKLSDVLTPPDLVDMGAAPAEIPAELHGLNGYKLGLMNTKKPMNIYIDNKAVLKKTLAMTEAAGISMASLKERPIFSVLVTLTSPLVFRDDAAEMIIELSRLQIPMLIDSGPMAGATAPVTLASTLVTGNAEHLASFVLAKSVNPDARVVYMSFARIFDMKSGTVSQGGPEYGMLRAGASQMARFYGIPSAGGGILTDSKLLDAQLGMEKMGTALLASLGGTNILIMMGLIASLNAISLEALMLDHEVVKYIKRVLQGIQVDDNTIDLSVFKEAGIGGEFISSDFTAEHFRKELWIPDLLNRANVELGVDFEKESLRARAKEAVKAALEKHVPPQLPEDIISKLDEIIYS